MFQGYSTSVRPWSLWAVGWLESCRTITRMITRFTGTRWDHCHLDCYQKIQNEMWHIVLKCICTYLVLQFFWVTFPFRSFDSLFKLRSPFFFFLGLLATRVLVYNLKWVCISLTSSVPCHTACFHFFGVVSDVNFNMHKFIKKRITYVVTIPKSLLIYSLLSQRLSLFDSWYNIVFQRLGHNFLILGRTTAQDQRKGLQIIRTECDYLFWLSSMYQMHQVSYLEKRMFVSEWNEITSAFFHTACASDGEDTAFQL